MGYSRIRETSIMLIQYVTGLLAIVFAGLHVALHSIIIPFIPSLEYETVLQLYKDALYPAVLWLLLVTVSVHGFNGLRVILLEFRQGTNWERAVNYAMLLATILLIAFGTRTIILAGRI